MDAPRPGALSSSLASICFSFEADFTANLRCIPMAVRRKLDLAGVKLKLQHWSELSEAERADLLAWGDDPTAIGTLREHLLAQLQAPITLLSRHPEHLELAEALRDELKTRGVALDRIAEPAPWEGPLLALHRLMEHHREQRLLLCPVDMPDLNLAALQTLLTAAVDPGPTQGLTRLHLAHDGERLQPLLGLYPSTAPIRSSLAAAVDHGERRLQRWLTEQPHHAVPLDPHAIRNVNRPEAAQPAESPSASAAR